MCGRRKIEVERVSGCYSLDLQYPQRPYVEGLGIACGAIGRCQKFEEVERKLGNRSVLLEEILGPSCLFSLYLLPR
jgi:hypothetical protein